LILSDDMGFSDIDRLAAGGLRFTQFYNAARCCPSRASLLTGLYPHQAGIGHMNSDRGHPSYRGELGPQAVTIAEVLRLAGYHNMMAGKWHVSHPGLEDKSNWPLQRGFDRFYGSLHGGGGYYNPSTLILDNTPVQVREDDYHWEHEGNRAVRKGDWKLVSKVSGRLGALQYEGGPDGNA
jgi:arylsulfatase